MLDNAALTGLYAFGVLAASVIALVYCVALLGRRWNAQDQPRPPHE